MDRKRIVITGLGTVSCFGNDVAHLYEQLLSGTSGVRKIEHFSVEGFPTQFGAYVSDFDSGDYIEKKQARRMDRFIKFSLVAGKKALESAQFSTDGLSLDKARRYGVVVGTGMGGMECFYSNAVAYKEKGLRRISPFFIPYTITNMASGMLAMDIGFMGPNYSISTACATGNHSIIAAANHIRMGQADMMVCGGVESGINEIGLAGFCAIKALSTRNEAPEQASRPWDQNRDGFVMGEGGGILVLESLEHALERGAPILAEYLGGGISCDAHHMTEPRPDGEGLAYCFSQAIIDAGLSPEEVDYVNAHATSTPAGDMVEVMAMKKVFANPQNIVVNSTKSIMGHCLGAAGGMEALACVMAISTGKIHPTVNLEDPEPGIGDFVVPVEALDREVRVAMSNSFGFGGHNASIVLGSYEPA